MDQGPILPPSGSFFCNIYHGQIQHFQQAVIAGKDRLRPGHLAKLTVKTLNSVRGIDQPPDLLGILEVGAQAAPVAPPGLRDFRVFPVLLLSKGIQSLQGCLLIHGGVDRLQVGHKRLRVLDTYLPEKRSWRIIQLWILVRGKVA